MYALLLVLFVQAQPEFQYEVLRSRSLQKDEPGLLRIDASGLEYRSTNGKTSVRVPFIDIYELDLSDSSAVRFETYEMLKRKLSGRRSYEFRLRASRAAEENDRLMEFVSSRVKRPVLGIRSISARLDFEIAAYHRHVLNGCSGTLQISAEGIRFLSSKEDHSRTWPYAEIETVGGADSFSFRIATIAETFNFDLKEPLPKEASDLMWRRVYDLPSRYGAGSAGERRNP
jgi:hypothetical protein